MEYAEVGQGSALLVIHGAGGGYDQGLALAGPLAATGCRVIAPSRFGYLRTPAPKHPSLALQAEAHACLLDALALPEAAVMGVSAGAPSAIEFALGYPQRCTHLVLLVPAGASPTPAASRGVPPAALATETESERRRVATVMRDISPLSERRVGLSLEAQFIEATRTQALEEISAPTLAISAEDDGYGTYENAQRIAARVRHGRFLGYRTGGHLLIGHTQEVIAAIAAFLRERTAAIDPCGARARKESQETR